MWNYMCNHWLINWSSFSYISTTNQKPKDIFLTALVLLFYIVHNIAVSAAVHHNATFRTLQSVALVSFPSYKSARTPGRYYWLTLIIKHSARTSSSGVMLVTSSVKIPVLIQKSNVETQGVHNHTDLRRSTINTKFLSHWKSARFKTHVLHT